MDTKIQELTDKIYKEGVEKGYEEAGRIIADANAQKQAILTEAEAEAKRIVAQAEKQAAELKKNTEAELKLFATQSVEALKSEVVNLITGKITSSNVKAIVSDTAFMQKVILEMAKAVSYTHLNFMTPFSPLKWGDAFTEGNSWHYTWSVFHDPQGSVSYTHLFTAWCQSFFGYRCYSVHWLVLLGFPSHGDELAHASVPSLYPLTPTLFV